MLRLLVFGFVWWFCDVILFLLVLFGFLFNSHGFFLYVCLTTYYDSSTTSCKYAIILCMRQTQAFKILASLWSLLCQKRQQINVYLMNFSEKRISYTKKKSLTNRKQMNNTHSIKSIRNYTQGEKNTN